MAHTFLNIGFEDPSVSLPAEDVDGVVVIPDEWTGSNTTSTSMRFAYWNDASLVLAETERFELEWTGLDTDPGDGVFLFEFDDPGTQLSAALFDIAADAFEDFEGEWDGNEAFFTELPATAAADFDTAVPEAVEDFEEEWSNSTYYTDFSMVSSSAAAFDSSTPENFEDFEEEWNSNENFAFDISGISTSAADFDGSSPEAFEDFEENDFVFLIVTVGTATAGEYKVTIDSPGGTAIVFSYTATGGDSVTSIRDALRAAVDASNLAIATADRSTNAFTIERSPLLPSNPDPFFVVNVSGPATNAITLAPPAKTEIWSQTGQLRTL